jgi:hypothetical protein
MNTQDSKTVELALGRILRMASRPTQSGDVAEYYRCRSLILDALEGTFPAADNAPCYVRDRNRGAQGDAA